MSHAAAVHFGETLFVGLGIGEVVVVKKEVALRKRGVNEVVGTKASIVRKKLLEKFV